MASAIPDAEARLDAAIVAIRERRFDDSESSLFALLAEVESHLPEGEEGKPDAPADLRLLKARVVGNLGNVLYRKGAPHLEQALEHFRDARRMFQDLDDGVREGSICMSMANALDRLGMQVEAVAMMREFLRLASAHGAPEKRTSAARQWIANRTGHAAGSGDGNPFGADDPKPKASARAPPPAKIRLSPMEALEAAAEAADTPLSDLLGSSASSMATPMLEFGFENLAFGDVVARSAQSLRMLSAVASMLRARAAAEERFAEALVAAKAEEPSGGVVGDVTAGLWSALGSVVGAGSAALGVEDPLSLLAEGEAAASTMLPPGADAEPSRRGSYGGGPSGEAAKPRWDNGTIASAVWAVERHAVSEAGRRRRLATAWNQGVAQLTALRSHHEKLHREASAAGEALVRGVTAARRKLSKAHVRLRRGQRAEAEAKSSLRRVHEALASLVEKAGAEGEGGADKAVAFKESREVQAEAMRRSKQVERAAAESSAAEASMQAAVVEHLTARRTRDSQLATLARRMQAAEEARLEGVAGALRLAGERWKLVQTASAESGGRLARAVDRADPGSDIRMFVHQRRVVRRVKEQEAELRRWEANRAEAEKRKEKRRAGEEEARGEGEAEGGGGGAGAAAVAAAAAGEAAAALEGAEGGAVAAKAPGRDGEAADGSDAASEASSADASAQAVAVPAAASAREADAAPAARREGWLQRLRRTGRGRAASSGHSDGDEAEEDETAGLEGLREADDEGMGVVPVSVSRERAATFASDSMRAEAELSPVARAWVVSLFRHATHGSAEGSRDAPGAAASDAASRADAALLEAVPEGPDRAAIEEGDDAALASRVFGPPSGRALFLSELNYWRAHGRRLRSGLARLGAVLRLALDACAAHNDVAAAKLLMIMSQTFYAVRGEDADADAEEEEAGVDGDAAAGDGLSEADAAARAAGRAAAAGLAEGEEAATKRFASDWLHGHPLWRRPEFWEEALYRSVREEAERPFAPFLRGGEAGVFTDRLVHSSSRAATGRQRLATAEAPAELAAGAPTAPAAPDAPLSPPFRPGSREWSYAYRQALFGQLGSYAMNMTAFGMPEERAAQVVARLARGNGLPAEMLQALLVSMDPRAADERRRARERRAAEGRAARGQRPAGSGAGAAGGGEQAPVDVVAEAGGGERAAVGAAAAEGDEAAVDAAAEAAAQAAHGDTDLLEASAEGGAHAAGTAGDDAGGAAEPEPAAGAGGTDEAVATAEGASHAGEDEESDDDGPMFDDD